MCVEEEEGGVSMWRKRKVEAGRKSEYEEKMKGGGKGKRRKLRLEKY